jgi:hypothetical protein
VNILILSGSYSEGRRFASRVGIRFPIVPANAGSLDGTRPHVILELPSFSGRPDRHAMNSALSRRISFSRGVDVIHMYIDAETLAFLERAPETDEPGQTTIDEQLALTETDRLRRLAAFEDDGGPAEPESKPAPPLTPPGGTGTFKVYSRAKQKRTT